MTIEPIEKSDSTEVKHGYQPDQLIHFPHALHAAEGIDCNYCHSTPNSKKAVTPSVKLCIECHETAKDAKGFDEPEEN